MALGTVGGIAGLIGLAAYEAWSTWKSFQSTKEVNEKLAKGYEARSQNADVKSDPNHPGVGYLTREQMEGKAEPKMAKEKEDKKRNAEQPKWMKDAIAKESADAIVGGGRKQIIINVKQFAEHFTVTAANLKEGATMTKEMFERMFV